MNNKQIFTANIQRMNELENKNDVNWNARYYREKNQQFYNSASYSAPSEAVEVEVGKRTIKAAFKRAQKVRHNPEPPKPLSKFVMIGGVPHKRTKDGYVALTPKSK
jgi:hypothetical protein